MMSLSGPFLVRNKFTDNHGFFYLETDDFNCTCSFTCTKHETLLKHLLLCHQQINNKDVIMEASYLQSNIPEIWETFCEIRDKRKHYICKPLICNNRLAVKSEYGHPLTDLMLNGYQLTSSMLDESAERYEVYIRETGFGPVNIYAVQNVTGNEDISFLERPGSPASQNELNGLESDVIIPQAQNHDVGGRRIYPTRRSIQLQREQEGSSLELASKIAEKDEILDEKRERPSNSPKDSSPEVEVVFQRHVESMKNTSKKEEKQTIEPRGNGPHQMDEPRNEDIEMVIILEKGKQDRKRCEDNDRLPVTIKRIRFDDQMEEKPNIMQGISSSQCTNIVRANTPFYNDK